MDKKYLIDYINIIDKLNRGEIISKTEDSIKLAVERDPNYRGLAAELWKYDRATGLALVEEAFKTQEPEVIDDSKIKDTLGKAYGIDMTNIEHIKLDNGLEVLTFYDDRLGRKRFIGYNDAKSLVTEFANIQNNNVMFQSDDYVKNAENIAKAEAGKYLDKELDMVDIETIKSEYYEQIKRIKDQDPREVQRLNELLKEAEKRRIKFINIENMVALDEDGNVIETHYDKQTDKVMLETPETMTASVDEVSNEEAVNDFGQSAESEVEFSVAPTDYESTDIIRDPEFIAMANESAEIYHMQCSREQLYANIARYSANMDLLEDDLAKNQITQDEYECYSMCCEKYLAIKNNKLAKARSLVYENNSLGSANILIISLVVIIIGLIIFMLLK